MREFCVRWAKAARNVAWRDNACRTLRRRAAQAAGKRRCLWSKHYLLGRFVGHLLTGRRWRRARRRIDEPAVLHDFFDLRAVERLVFEQSFRNHFESLAMSRQ